MQRLTNKPLVRLFALVLGSALLWAGVAGAALPLLISESRSDHFSLMRWEVMRLPRKYVHAAGAWMRGEPTGTRDAFLDYFNGLHDRGRSGLSAPVAPDRVVILRPQAEAALEAALSREVERAGLDTAIALGRFGRVVWPPVDVSFADTPFVLIVARRDRIELVRTEVLRPGLTGDDIARIEAAEARSGYSVLIEPLGGLAAYPAVVRVTDGPRQAVEIAVHEWVHHYLAFYPLGAAYGTSPAMTSINETVADIIARELADAVIARLDVPAGTNRATPGVDVWRVLRDLRIDVDALLARGDVAGAEARMEEVRLSLAAEGVYYRRINQAFFAFRNLYAGSAGARNPLGPALQRLRRASPTLQSFVAVVRDFSHPDELNRALGALPDAITSER